MLTDGIETSRPDRSIIRASPPRPTRSASASRHGISTVALDALAQSTGKYLLVTGALTARPAVPAEQVLPADPGRHQQRADRCRPDRQPVFGPTHRIPFDVQSADYGIDAILTSPLVQAIDFRLEAPDGTIVDPGLLAGAGEFVLPAQVGYYRLPLPFGGPGKGIHAGRWHALLTLTSTA